MVLQVPVLRKQPELPETLGNVALLQAALPLSAQKGLQFLSLGQIANQGAAPSVLFDLFSFFFF